MCIPASLPGSRISSWGTFGSDTSACCGQIRPTLFLPCFGIEKHSSAAGVGTAITGIFAVEVAGSAGMQHLEIFWQRTLSVFFTGKFPIYRLGSLKHLKETFSELLGAEESRNSGGETGKKCYAGAGSKPYFQARAARTPPTARAPTAREKPAGKAATKAGRREASGPFGTPKRGGSGQGSGVSPAPWRQASSLAGTGMSRGGGSPPRCRGTRPRRWRGGRREGVPEYGRGR